MWPCKLLIQSLVVICLFAEPQNAVRVPDEANNAIQTSILLSPPYFMRPGSVTNKFSYNVPFPRGHIAIKSFNAEVVDERGTSVPLYETYVHHWFFLRYYAKASSTHEDIMNINIVGNAGTCKGPFIERQHFGLGSESRGLTTWIPDPYGIEVGDPKKIPSGYEERWLMQIHFIDTRGVKDVLGCTECHRSLYNVSTDESGHPLGKDYVGGYHCCHDQTQCQLRKGHGGGEIRKLYLRYTVSWVHWLDTIVPVKIYFIDVTDLGETPEDALSSCQVEYNVDKCEREIGQNEMCVHSKRARVAIPHGGDIVYAYGHQHSFGLGIALYGQDGKILCTSLPIYGNGKEPGNEDGYLVGMSTCYPKPGSVTIADGEILTIESNYSNNQIHIGIMGIFYVLVAERQTQTNSVMIFHNLSLAYGFEVVKHWVAFLFVGGFAMIVVGVNRARHYGEEYGPL